MKRIFKAEKFFMIPDGTRIAPILNAWDTNETELSLDALEGVSIAVGEIPAGSRSKPHILKGVSQVTWVLSGSIHVRVKEHGEISPYDLEVDEGQGFLTPQLSYLQLVNLSKDVDARVLYIVIPAYVYEAEQDGYDDSQVVDKPWNVLTREGFPLNVVGTIEEIKRLRAAAMKRIRTRKTQQEI